MPATIDNHPEATSLEDELQQLALEENDLDDRASSLELRTVLVALLAGTAETATAAAPPGPRPPRRRPVPEWQRPHPLP
jgi:hypothetical protein